jgi:hypothetical protein
MKRNKKFNFIKENEVPGLENPMVSEEISPSLLTRTLRDIVIEL